MHELSIALSMIDMAVEEAERRGNARVQALHLRLGPLSGVVKDALVFAYDVASQDTPLSGSRLEIEEIPVVVFCPECRRELVLEDIRDFSCPACGTVATQLVSGRELELAALELE